PRERDRGCCRPASDEKVEKENMTGQNDPTVISTWIGAVWKAGGTDLLLTAGVPPLARVDGEYAPVEGAAVLTADETDQLAKSVLAPDLYEMLQDRQQVDFSLT